MSDYYQRGDPIYDFSDPARVGPGLWMSFFIQCGNAVDESARFAACIQIRAVVEHMGCSQCEAHSISKIQRDPPEGHISSNRDLFDWVVGFLNSVNLKQGKKLYQSDLLWERFVTGTQKVCTGNCGSDTKKRASEKSPASMPRRILTVTPNGRRW